MRKEELKNLIKAEVERLLPEELQGSEVRLNEVEKNNTTLTALLIMEKGRNVAPSIYLNGYINDIQEGRDIVDIAAEIISIHLEYRNPPVANFDVNRIGDWNYVQENGTFKKIVVGLNGNEKYLQDRVCDIFLDMAVVYVYFLEGVGSITLTKQMLNAWGVTEEQIKSLVQEETYELINMWDLFFGMLNEEEHVESNDTKLSMYVLTNETHTQGAAFIADKSVLKEVSKRIGEKFYVLPSSIHEVICVPKFTDDNSELKNMVEEVNATMLRPDEVLTNSIYFFDGEELSIAY